MSVDLVQQLTAALQGAGQLVTQADVALAYMNLDVASITNQAQSRVSWQVWDKKTPINGVDPDHFLARSDFANADEVYLILVDGHVVYVQPHTRDEGIVPIDAGSVGHFAEEHAHEIAESLAFQSLVESIGTAFAQRSTPPPTPTVRQTPSGRSQPR